MDSNNNIQNQTQQQYYPMPRIGDQAPAFEAVTTQGRIKFPEDFKGKWKILFSHPADFTPVCTSEFMTFASRAAEFEALNTQLIGLSVDGLYSHIAWLRTIQEKIQYKGMKNVEVKFPLIEDITMDIARKYGMIQPGESATQAVRAVFFIDPKNVIRTIIYYPLSLGRNFDELKRVLVGLQTADEFGVALPADWQPGDEGEGAPGRFLRSGQEPDGRRRQGPEVLRLVLLHPSAPQGEDRGQNLQKIMKRIATTLLMAGTLLLSALPLTAYGQERESGKNEEKMETGTIHLTKAEFLQKVWNYEANSQAWKYEGTKPAIVDFFATWCGPCKALSPVLEELAKEYGDRLVIYKVDVDQERELAGAFGIRSVPTLLFIPADGEPSMSPGAPSKAQLKQIIDEHLLK